MIRYFENNFSSESFDSDFDLMIHDVNGQLIENYWKTSNSQKYKHLRIYRLARNKIHFTETHSEREFGHILHIENKKRRLLDDLLQCMVRVFFNDPNNIERQKGRMQCNVHDVCR